MKAAFVEMIGGASGNMLIGACIDAGVELAALERSLRTIPVEGWRLHAARVTKRGVAATYFDIVVPGEDHHHDHPDAHAHPPGIRTLDEVVAIFERSALSSRQKRRARAIVERLHAAEGQERFHAVGQIDAILDIAGTCVAFDLLEVERLFCSPYPLGRIVPKATAVLLRGAPTRTEAIDAEMVTTTAAAILSALVDVPGKQPLLRGECSGYGAGRSDFPMPNVTRLAVGEID